MVASGKNTGLSNVRVKRVGRGKYRVGLLESIPKVPTFFSQSDNLLDNGLCR